MVLSTKEEAEYKQLKDQMKQAQKAGKKADPKVSERYFALYQKKSGTTIKQEAGKKAAPAEKKAPKESKVKKEVVKKEPKEKKAPKEKKPMKSKPAPSPSGSDDEPAGESKRKPKQIDDTEETIEPKNAWWTEVEAELLLREKRMEMEKAHPIENEEDAARRAEELADENKKVETAKWTRHMQHYGIMFPAPYAGHHVPLHYKGKAMELPPDVEELCSFWCSVIGLEAEKKSIFINNFFTEFKRMCEKYLDEKKWEHLGLIQDFGAINWDVMAKFLKEEKEAWKNRSKEQKADELAERKIDEAKYMYALLDDYREKVGSYKIEPPGLFRGRGEHPKQGKLKERVMPTSCTINIDQTLPPPVCHVAGENWEEVVHDSYVTWLGFYKQEEDAGDDGKKKKGPDGSPDASDAEVNDSDDDDEDGMKKVGGRGSMDDLLNDEDRAKNFSVKYVHLHATSQAKCQPDILKYERAKRLAKCIDTIRNDYQAKIRHDGSAFATQLGTAIYFIDRLALRVGNEKNTEDEADTVGCTSLRVEHCEMTMETLAAKSGQQRVTLDFLGKDSIRYLNEVSVPRSVFKNLCIFKHNKKPKDQLFSEINPGVVNDYLHEFMPDLSAKVFRTYNASFTLEKELAKFDPSQLADASSQEELLKFYNEANRKVAILCNHQKAVAKGHSEMMKKHQDVLDWMTDQIDILSTTRKHYEDKKRNSAYVVDTARTEEANEAYDEKYAKFVKAIPRDSESCKRKILGIKQRIEKKTNEIEQKEGNKNVSLTTSRINYMDPRITIAWCKKVGLHVGKIFSASVIVKFPWAMDVNPDYRFFAGFSGIAKAGPAVKREPSSSSDDMVKRQRLGSEGN